MIDQLSHGVGRVCILPDLIGDSDVGDQAHDRRCKAPLVLGMHREETGIPMSRASYPVFSASVCAETVVPCSSSKAAKRPASKAIRTAALCGGFVEEQS